METRKTIPIFYNINQGDNNYVTILPINTTDEVLLDLETKRTLSEKLTEMTVDISKNNESLTEDLLTIISKLSSFVEKPILLNHIYVDDLSNSTTLDIFKGVHTPGKITI